MADLATRPTVPAAALGLPDDLFLTMLLYDDP